jgi:hypothetical protein
MKNTKNIFVSVLSIVLLSLQTLCIAHDLTFELFNKDTKTIKWNLYDKQEKLISEGLLAPGQKAYLPQKANEIALNASRLMLRVTSRHDGGAQMYYHIDAPGKTKCITWNPVKTPALYPQTGPYLGLAGTTESGLPLNNNVQSSEIRHAH